MAVNSLQIEANTLQIRVCRADIRLSTALLNTVIERANIDNNTTNYSNLQYLQHEWPC